MIPQQFIYLIIPLQFLVVYFNFKGILSNQIRPNLSSYTIWISATSLAIVGGLLKGSNLLEQLSSLVGVISMLSIVVLSLITRRYFTQNAMIEKICFGLGLAGILSLVFVQEKNVAITLSIIIDALACLPTVIKILKTKDENESFGGFFAIFIMKLINLLTISVITYENSGFLIYTLFSTATISLLIIWKNNKIKNKVETLNF